MCVADDPQLAEFLQLMQPRRAGTIWSNDDVAPAKLANARTGGAVAAGTKPSADQVCDIATLLPEQGSVLISGLSSPCKDTEHVPCVLLRLFSSVLLASAFCECCNLDSNVVAAAHS